MLKIKIAFISFLLAFNVAHAEAVISFYGGAQISPHSKVSGTDQQGNRFNFTSRWEEKSFSMPVYYGVRYTNWAENNTAISLDFTHSKVYADATTLNKSGFKTLEFTDGLNVLTLNRLKRYIGNNFNRYWGVGAGITIPHVEVQTSPTSRKTFEYQFGGYALQAQAGLEKRVSNNWSVFTEYKLNYTVNSVDLQGGGKLKTNIIINAINFGINYTL